MNTSATATPEHPTPLARKLGAFVRLTPAELERLERLQARRRVFKARVDLLHESQVERKAFILQNGWAVSYKLLPDGGRQVVDFQIPGDYLGVRSLLLRTSDHSAAAVTDIVACEVGAAELTSTFEALPRLGMAMLWAASRDEAMVVEHLTGIGRRNPIARTAHYFLELQQRLRLVGQADEDGFRCPLSQYLLSDALGLSAIHLNRTLRQLRERRLMTLRAGKLTIHDETGLRALAGFENGYLDQHAHPPRTAEPPS